MTATNLILMLLASNINSLRSVNYLLTTAKLAIMWVSICLSARIFMFHLMFIRKTEEAEWRPGQECIDVPNIQFPLLLYFLYCLFTLCLLFTQSKSSYLIVKSDISYKRDLLQHVHIYYITTSKWDLNFYIPTNIVISYPVLHLVSGLFFFKRPMALVIKFQKALTQQ